MKKKQTLFSIILVFSLLISTLGVAVPALAATLPFVDDFESGLPTGKDANNISVGFVTFNDPNSSVAISTTVTPPAAVPGATDPNTVLKMDLSVTSYAGFVHNFENATATEWVPQDWSAYPWKKARCTNPRSNERVEPIITIAEVCFEMLNNLA